MHSSLTNDLIHILYKWTDVSNDSILYFVVVISLLGINEGHPPIHHPSISFKTETKAVYIKLPVLFIDYLL